MIQIDLITGFLGSGKTTFLKKYVEYLLKQGLKVGIIENDFGAVNVDMMLLQDIVSKNCELEMVAGACDRDCHMRRFKTKLISMKLRGFDRIVVEPSGIYDVDEFFDVLHEEPLNNWYEIKNVITIVDSQLTKNLSRASRYLLASQLVIAGKIIFSKVQYTTEEKIKETKQYLNESLRMFHGKEKHDNDFITLDWSQFTENDLNQLQDCGYQYDSIEKLWFDYNKAFSSLYFMNKKMTKTQLINIVKNIFNDKSCGNVYRIKGFVLLDDYWIELNATCDNIEVKNIENGQEIIIVIGENLIETNIQKYFEKS